MSDLYLPWTTGKTLDVYVVNATNQRYRFDTHVFENYNAANWTNYGSSTGVTEQAGSGDYFIALPTTGVAVGTYSVVVRERQGGSGGTPAITDPVIGGPVSMDYSGTAWKPTGTGSSGGGGGGGGVTIREVEVGVTQR